MLSTQIKITSFLVSSVLLLIFLTFSVAKPTVGLNVTPKLISKRNRWELDTASMLAKSDFKIKPAALIERCKEVIGRNVGLDDENDLAEDFTFQFPIVGPLSKKEYLE